MFQLPYTIPAWPHVLKHTDRIMLMGSCFTEHIGNRMQEAKMHVLMNPKGILFNPLGIAEGLQACVDGKRYGESDLFYLNGIWSSWDFHSRFSHTDKEKALEAMNRSLEESAAFLLSADWLLITFGSAFRYYTTGKAAGMPGYGVDNCHKAPGQWFEKRLLSLEEMEAAWRQTIGILRRYNPGLRLLFTVSPVRHLRDGLAENNRSKARLIELAHRLTETYAFAGYFPAYELVIDVLRDYRFFAPDMTHPTDQAAQYVWEQFVKASMGERERALMERIKEITTAMQHRPRFPGTDAARQFREAILQKIGRLQAAYPYLDLEAEKAAFA